MRKNLFSEEQIIGILKRVEAGQPLADVCREVRISDGTRYRWKAQHGGLKVGQLRRLRQLEDENRKLKQVVADLTLDNRVEGHRLKQLVTLMARRAAYATCSRPFPYRRRVKPDEAGIRDRSRALAGERPSWGADGCMCCSRGSWA
jgi:putative transposase